MADKEPRTDKGIVLRASLFFEGNLPVFHEKANIIMDL